MNSPIRKLHSRQEPPLALHDRAMDNLQYIRETMERSEAFTHVSGAGSVLMGLVALAAAALASAAADATEWITIWLVAAGMSFGIAALSIVRKSRSEGISILSGPARTFAWSAIPPLAAGGVLTLALVRGGALDLLPGMWLLVYGTGVVTGGAHSVRPVPAMGAAFMLAGLGALLTPAAWGQVWMAAGFGGLHVLFGAVIWRKHGG